MIELKAITMKKMTSVDCTFMTHTRNVCNLLRKLMFVASMSSGRHSNSRLEPVVCWSTNKHHAESTTPGLIKMIGCTERESAPLA